MARMARPRRAIVNFRGIDHELDIPILRLALVRRQVAGEYESMQELAEAVGCSRSTVSRFFSGRPTSLTIAIDVVDKLKLSFEEVFTPVNLDSA